MSVSAMLRSAHVAIFVAILFAMSVAGEAAIERGASTHQQEATPKEISVASNILLYMFAQRGDIPNSRPSVDMKRPYFRRDSTQAEKRMLVVAKVNFPASANSYCRIFILPSDLSKAVLVSAPAKANYDDCARSSRPIYADLMEIA